MDKEREAPADDGPIFHQEQFRERLEQYQVRSDQPLIVYHRLLRVEAANRTQSERKYRAKSSYPRSSRFKRPRISPRLRNPGFQLVEPTEKSRHQSRVLQGYLHIT